MEETVLHEMRHIIGFPNAHGDGIFCPGGSIANGYAISCARYNFAPDVKVGIPVLECTDELGWLRVFLDLHSPYSVRSRPLVFLHSS